MWNSIHQTVGSLSPGVRRFIATESLFGIGAGIFNLILNLHLLSIGLQESEIGELTSMGALATGVLSIPSGYLVQRIGRKSMLVIGMLLCCSGLIGFGAATAKPAIIAAQLCWSIGITAIVTSEIQLLFQYCQSKREETTAYSLLFAVFTLFTGVGTLLGGYLPLWLGGRISVYQNSFFVAAACFAAAGTLRGLLLPSSPEQVGQGGKAAAEAATSKRAGRIGLVVILSLFLFNAGLTFGFLGTYLNVIMKYRFSWSDEQISLLLTASGFFFFLGSLLMPRVLDRFGPRRAFGFLFGTNAVLVFLMAFAVPVPLFSAMLLLRGGLSTMLNNMMDSEAMSAVPEQDRNLFAGMRTVSRNAGGALAAYWAGYIMAGKNYTLPFLLTAASLALGYVLYAVWVRRVLDRRQQAA